MVGGVSRGMTMGSRKPDPPIRFCPFCGRKGPEIRKATGLLWCPVCRMTWILGYRRQLRAKPKRARG